MIHDETGRAMMPVLACQGESEARVAISFLASMGIQAQLNSEVPQEVLPLTVDGLGRVEVLVPADLADHALELLEERTKNSPFADDDA